MLHEASAAGGAQGLAVGVSIGLRQGHTIVVGVVRSAQQTADQVVGEDAAAQTIALLGILALGRAGDDRLAVALQAVIYLDLEGFGRRSALDPGQTAGTAGVDDEHADVGASLAHQRPQAIEGEPLPVEVHGAGAGVAAVVDQQHGRGVLLRASLAGDPTGQVDQHALHRSRATAPDQEHVLRLHATEADQHIA